MATKEELVSKYAQELSQGNAVSARPGSFVSGYRSSAGGDNNNTKPLNMAEVSQLQNSSYMNKETELTT